MLRKTLIIASRARSVLSGMVKSSPSSGWCTVKNSLMGTMSRFSRIFSRSTSADLASFSSMPSSSCNPTSKLHPLRLNVEAAPPNLSWRSSTSTFLPSRAARAPAVSPPRPNTIEMAS